MGSDNPTHDGDQSLTPSPDAVQPRRSSLELLTQTSEQKTRQNILGFVTWEETSWEGNPERRKTKPEAILEAFVRYLGTVAESKKESEIHSAGNLLETLTLLQPEFTKRLLSDSNIATYVACQMTRSPEWQKFQTVMQRGSTSLKEALLEIENTERQLVGTEPLSLTEFTPRRQWKFAMQQILGSFALKETSLTDATVFTDDYEVPEPPVRQRQIADFFLKWVQDLATVVRAESMPDSSQRRELATLNQEVKLRILSLVDDLQRVSEDEWNNLGKLPTLLRDTEVRDLARKLLAKRDLITKEHQELLEPVVQAYQSILKRDPDEDLALCKQAASLRLLEVLLPISLKFSVKKREDLEVDSTKLD